MKQCTYCGKEYPDDASICVVDNKPLQDVGVATSKAPFPLTAILSIAAFSVLSAFTGVGVAWMVTATIANHMSQSGGEAFVAGSGSIHLAGGILGFVVGLVGRIIWWKRKHDAS